MKVVTVPEMLAIERAADLGGHSYPAMMEAAGRALAEWILWSYPDSADPTALGLVGPGNNGGDTLLALLHLANAGWNTTAWLITRPESDDELIERARLAGCEILSASSPGDPRVETRLSECRFVLDGVFGTGIRLPLRPPAAELLAFAKSRLSDRVEPAVVVAVDCPSGVDCQTGAAAPQSIRADHTVCMAAAKIGLFALPAAGLVGHLVTVSIGLSEGLPEWQVVSREAVDEQRVREILPDRLLDAHKGTFGTALIGAGSVNYPGAVYLAASAAYRVGAGLVNVACPQWVCEALAGQIPEAIWFPLPQSDGALGEEAAELLRTQFRRATSVLIGPGLGLARQTLGFVEKLLEGGSFPPAVVDADGLKLLARVPDWSERLPGRSILTPHPGEMSVLTGLTTAAVQADRLQAAETFARQWNQIVVLKGAFTLIADPDGRIALIPIATPALARAGSGDVLAGAIAGLLAQGLDPFEAALAGAWIHARAGLTAANTLGSSAAVLARDILNSLPAVLSRLSGTAAGIDLLEDS